MVAFGIRNLADVDRGFRELFRVLRPGGRLVILEFTTPPNRVMRGLYHFYFHRILPLVGRIVSGHPWAYTGADGSRRGLARMAHQGTLFLDEIGVLPKRDQARLLTLLETDRIRPVGSDRDEHVDLRVVAATSADIVEMARRKEFRADLLDRFAPPFIRLPPLSERIGEMPAIVDRLIVEIAARGLVQLPDGLPRVDEGAVRLLQRQAWPNSIRELRTVLVQALVHGRGRRVGPEQIMVVLRDREVRTDTHASSVGDLPPFVQGRRVLKGR